MDSEREDGKPSDRFHIGREISISHIITTVMIGVSGMWWAANMDTKNQVQDNEIKTLGRESARIQLEVREAKLETKDELKSINSKLDRLVERGTQ